MEINIIEILTYLYTGLVVGRILDIIIEILAISQGYNTSGYLWVHGGIIGILLTFI